MRRRQDQCALQPDARSMSPGRVHSASTRFTDCVDTQASERTRAAASSSPSHPSHGAAQQATQNGVPCTTQWSHVKIKGHHIRGIAEMKIGRKKCASNGTLLSHVYTCHHRQSVAVIISIGTHTSTLVLLSRTPDLPPPSHRAHWWRALPHACDAGALV